LRDREDRNRDDRDREDRDARNDLTPVRPKAPGTSAPTTAPPAGTDPAPIPLPGRMPPSTSVLMIAGLGAFGLAAAAVYVFYKGRGAALQPDAAPRYDARFDRLEPEAAPLIDAAGPTTE